MPSAATERLTPRARQIVCAARELIEEEGLEALTMRRLAARLGIRAPSLYKHFDSKEALEAALISIGFEEQGELFDAALEASKAPIGAMAEAYRSYARRNPQLYLLMNDRSLDRSLLFPGSEERAVVPVVRAVGGDRDIDRFVELGQQRTMAIAVRSGPEGQLCGGGPRGDLVQHLAVSRGVEEHEEGLTT